MARTLAELRTGSWERRIYSYLLRNHYLEGVNSADAARLRGAPNAEDLLCDLLLAEEPQVGNT